MSNLSRKNANRPPREPWTVKGTARTRQEKKAVQRQIDAWFAAPNGKEKNA